MRLIQHDARHIAVKRFNLPVTAVDNCPKCAAEVTREFQGDDYISYPAIGVPERIYFYCEPCAVEWERHIVIQFSVTVAPGEEGTPSVALPPYDPDAEEEAE